VLSWMTFNAENGHEIELRIPVPEEQAVYVTSIRMKDRTMYVRYVHAAPGLIGKVLHQWDDQVNYRRLTLEEIKSSVNRAEATNLILDCDVMKNYVTNFVTEQLANSQEEQQPVPSMNDTGKINST